MSRSSDVSQFGCLAVRKTKEKEALEKEVLEKDEDKDADEPKIEEVDEEKQEEKKTTTVGAAQQAALDTQNRECDEPGVRINTARRSLTSGTERR